MDKPNTSISRLSLAVAVAVALLSSCVGPPGPEGAAGQTGATGAVGTAGTAGTNGTAGTAGTNGTDGAPCTVAVYDGGVTVTCPGSSPVNVPNGSNGQSCTVTNIDAGVIVTCPGSSPVTVLNGTSVTGKPALEQCLICHGPGALAPITTMHSGEKAFNPIAGLKVTVLSVSPTEPITVAFKVSDERNNPVDLNGLYSINTPFVPRFSLSRIETAVNPADGGMIMLPYKVISRTGSKTAALASDPAPAVGEVFTNPNTFTPTFPIPSAGVPATDAAMKGLLVENGSGLGTYTYTFPTGGNTDTVSGGKHVRTVTEAVTYNGDLSSTYTVWMQTSRQWDLVFQSNLLTFKAVDTEYNFIPNGSGTPLKRRIVSQAACDKCHNGFKRDLNPNYTLPTVNGFHGGGRVESTFCNVCHNQTAVNADGTPFPQKYSSSFVHRVHASTKLVANPDGGAISADAWHDIEIGFPQDVRGCDVCHGEAGALQGWQATALPSLVACGSCHDGVDFSAGSALSACTSPAAVDANGRFIPCKHVGGPQANNANCTLCHGDSSSLSPITGRHLRVLPPDPMAPRPGALADGGWGLPDGGTGNGNVNAAYIAAANDVPPGASKFTYDVKEVKVVSGKIQMIFKMKQSINGAAPVDVDFGTYNAASNKELIPGFVGGPSAYFVFSLPQDGIAAPADFNSSASCYIKSAWAGTATSGAGACTLSAKDGLGYYTVQMTNVVLPANAVMLTGGLGYTYNVTSTRPLTQTNLSGYPYSATTGIGGLLVASTNVWKVGTGFTGRRTVVESARCNNCHAQLGVGPTFHAGQRNTGETCNFCHNPNRNSSGWAANQKDFIHAIHGGRIRTVPFSWHALSESENFSDVEFPSNINNCEACHLPGTYDFTLASTVNALPNMLLSTAATGKLNRDPVTNPASWFTIAPANYVLADNTYDYGAGWTYNALTGATTEAAGTTLVKTPITAACSACHDASASIAHMENNGGAFYKTRNQVFGK